MTEGIRLTVDGTEPALVVDMLEIRGGTILRNRTIRGHMAIEGWMAIQAGDNPAIVAQKLTTYFIEEPEFAGSVPRDQSVDALISVLQKTPVSRMSLAELVDFFHDLAVLARQKGLEALTPVAAQVDDPVLAAGMGATANDADAGQLMTLMGQRLQEERVALHQRHCLVIKGIAGIQAGKKIDVLVAEAKQWAEEQAAALPSASTPSPTTPL